MIYLFDDNSHNQLQENYFIDYTKFMEEHKHLVKWIKKPEEALKKTILDAKAICIHESFAENVNKTQKGEAEFVKEISAIAKNKNIPLVIFSNGFTQTMIEHDNFISKIKKDRFYRNFKNFVLDKNINLMILVSGKFYTKEKARQIDDFFGSYLLAKTGNFDYEPEIKTDSMEFKHLKELFHLAYPQKDVDNFENELDLYNESLTFADFKQKIKNMVNTIKQQENE